MSTAGAVDLPLEVFGSFCPELPPGTLPAGLSPFCQDVEYIRGGVKTRAGLAAQFAALPGNPTVNYLRSYVTPALVLRMLALDSLGNVYKETPMGTLNTIIGTVMPGSYAKSTTCFGREYMAFGDGLNGIDMPRQYDDTNFDRVSQCGPGAAPVAVDEVFNPSIASAAMPAAVNIVASPNGASQSGFLVTITTTGAHGLIAGQNVVVAGVGSAGYNNGAANPAVFIVNSVPSATTFTYVLGTQGLPASGNGTAQSCIATYTTPTNHGVAVGMLITIAGIAPGGYNVTSQSIYQVPSPTTFTLDLSVAGLAAGGAGTGTIVGSIAAGLHKVSVMFQTRQGFFTAPAPFTSWTASGSKRAVLSGIPTGPANVVGRVVVFTAVGGANFYYTSAQSPLYSGNMVIGDNTTTSLTVDFTDAVLLAGTNVDANFNLVELGECAGVIDYSNRLFWWGERAKIQNILNFTFDGGFASNGLPLGWTADPTSFAGGAGDYANPYWGGDYSITGDGATAVRGKITQSVFQDFRGVPILSPATAYSVRARVARNNGISQGTLHVNMFSASLGINTAGLQVTVAQATTSYVEFSAAILSAQASIPSDLVIQVFADGTPTNGGILRVENIEIFPTAQPFNLTTIRASYNGNNLSPVLGQESYDGVTGLMQPQAFDGQAVRCMFKIREFIYVVKERSMYVTKDDNVNEPSFWTFRQVSLTVGTPSVNGVAVGEDWAVIANRSGLYMFNGSEPQKISQEVQSDQTDLGLTYFWDNVNWSAGQLLWTAVDTLNRRILVGLPFGNATTPNGVFYLDYRALKESEDVITGDPVHTGYSGKTLALERARKWAPWSMTVNCAASIERANGTSQLFLGSGLANGLIWGLSKTQFSDTLPAATAINSFYYTYAFPTHEQEQGFQIGSHKKLFTYVTSYVQGSGLLNLNFYKENPATAAQQLPSWNLDTATARDHEFTINADAERGFFSVGSNSVGSWFKLTKLVPSLKPSVIATRGVS